MANDTAQQTSCPAEPAAAPKVLELPPRPPANEPSERFDEPPMGCSTQFDDILYSTEQQEFWLLPKRAATQIDEAIDTLARQISPAKAADERKKGLDQCGLLDYFLEPHLSNFLEGEDQARLLEIEREEPHIEDPSRAMRIKTAARKQAAGPKPETASQDRMQVMRDQEQMRLDQEEFREMLKLHHEWQQLCNKAIAQARQQGYTYEAGSLFQPEAITARSWVQRYLELRKIALAKGDFDMDSEAVAQYLAEDKQRFEAATDCTEADCSAKMQSYINWKAAHSDKQNYADYRTAILKAADYGLALPEYALLPGKGPDITNGIKKFKEYLKLESAQFKLIETMRNKYKRWIEATGESISAPANLVDDERDAWEKLEAQRKALQAVAQANVDNGFPRRHLLWNPQDFKPKPVERLVKADFPLREVSRLKTPNKPLSYFSLLNLDDVGQYLKTSVQSSLNKSGKALKGKPASSDGKAGVDTATPVFHEWLKREGAVRIRDQDDDWFDAEGWFDVDKFHNYLESKHYQVKTLSSKGDRAEWGERLRQMVFKDVVRRELRLFDPRPQAQLVRCLVPSQERIHGSTKVAGPALSATKGATSSANVTLDIDLARGEVDLFKVDLPSRTDAQPVKLTYQNYRGEQCHIELGRFSMHFAAKAWGFAGASMLLSTQLEVSPANTRYGYGLTPIEEATRNEGTYSSASSQKSGQVLNGSAAQVKIDKGVSGKFSVFAGTQAGIQLTGALNWAPPPNLIPMQPGKNASQWLSLARLTVDAAAAFGAGASAGFDLSLYEGRLILNMKAAWISGPGASGSFKFEVGYQGIADILHLFRRELHRNNNQPLEWVDGPAGTYMSVLNRIGVLGFDPTMAYLMAYDNVMSLYEALSRQGRGGLLAHMIVTYPKAEELNKWIVMAPASALGPLLYTLSSAPKKLEVPANSPAEKSKTYDPSEAYLLQQRAISRIISCIAREVNEHTQNQFTESCIRMNKFGDKPKEHGQAYCENRMKLDMFMKEPILRFSRVDGIAARSAYIENSSALGVAMNNKCQITYFNNHPENPAGFSKYVD
ncbi:hypothetical protein KSS93_25980 [Pseudomonas xanthosomatis]|uniref:hypothetical protein n=1 Tax=Pseudomonas xanthosomatis TaxID=2842356 RepID=UPI001C3CC631|nr:hypothetical protein [Pseudomonas xanthosomatis]QXH46271.1 hypothetical protein KSS93_25980 [Pseudomonas xanthosomatis]